MDNKQCYSIEQQYHDKKVSKKEQADVIYSTGMLTQVGQYTYELSGDLKNKKILDLGCGTGHHAVIFGLKGVIVYVIDLSQGMVESVKNRAREEDPEDRVKIFQMSVKKLQLPDETFDLVFGNSILRHTDLGPTRHEVYRVLSLTHRELYLLALSAFFFVSLRNRRIFESTVNSFSRLDDWCFAQWRGLG